MLSVWYTNNWKVKWTDKRWAWNALLICSEVKFGKFLLYMKKRSTFLCMFETKRTLDIWMKAKNCTGQKTWAFTCSLRLRNWNPVSWLHPKEGKLTTETPKSMSSGDGMKWADLLWFYARSRVSQCWPWQRQWTPPLLQSCTTLFPKYFAACVLMFHHNYNFSERQWSANIKYASLRKETSFCSWY